MSDQTIYITVTLVMIALGLTSIFFGFRIKESHKALIFLGCGVIFVVFPVFNVLGAGIEDPRKTWTTIILFLLLTGLRSYLRMLKNQAGKIICILFFLIPCYAQSQYKLDKISISSGESALTSGLDTYVCLRDSATSISFQGNSDRIYAMYGYETRFVTVYASGGIFRNTPWCGPRIELNPTNFLSVFYWYGCQAGTLGKPGWYVTTQAHMFSATLSRYNITAGYFVMYFVGDWIHLPGASYKMEITKNFSCLAGADYYHERRHPIFRIEIAYKFE